MPATRSDLDTAILGRCALLAVANPPGFTGAAPYAPLNLPVALALNFVGIAIVNPLNPADVDLSTITDAPTLLKVADIATFQALASACASYETVNASGAGVSVSSSDIQGRLKAEADRWQALVLKQYGYGQNTGQAVIAGTMTPAAISPGLVVPGCSTPGLATPGTNPWSQMPYQRPNWPGFGGGWGW